MDETGQWTSWPQSCDGSWIGLETVRKRWNTAQDAWHGLEGSWAGLAREWQLDSGEDQEPVGQVGGASGKREVRGETAGTVRGGTPVTLFGCQVQAVPEQVSLGPSCKRNRRATSIYMKRRVSAQRQDAL